MCGIIGVISKENRGDLGRLIYFGLGQMQNRGDFSAGIATIKKLSMSRNDYRLGRMSAVEHSTKQFESLSAHKGEGLVSEVFKDRMTLDKLVGFMGIGQVRYPTASYIKSDDTLPIEELKAIGKANIQPLIAPWGRIAAAHNGDIHNYHELMEYFSEKGWQKAGNNDMEALLNVFTEEFFRLSENLRDIDRLEKTMSGVYERVKGTYSVVSIINNVGLLAFRDPNGRRPLLFGVKTNEEGKITDYAFASESAALDKMLFKGTLDTKYASGNLAYDEVKPGEFVFISKDFKFFRRQIVIDEFKPCPFEGSYFARASSHINNTRVKRIRRAIIDSIWERFSATDTYKRIMEHKDDVIIVGVPRTAETAAKYLSNKTGIYLEDAIEKNPSAPRLFQQPTQEHRRKQTIAEHYIFDEDVRDKIVLVIDDSIVRGTTMIEDVKYLRDVGAKEVHLFITFPTIRHPCMHAVDFHTPQELIAHGKTLDEIKQALTLRPNESLVYATPDDIKKANGYQNINMCNECYLNGDL